MADWIEHLDWSPWVQFADAALDIPRLPGVYVARLPSRQIIYVGMAGERSGNGLRGRYRIYASGRGATTGFGQACLDRALADPVFVGQQLDAARAGNPARAVQWAVAAIQWFQPEMRWVVVSDRAAAQALEGDIVSALRASGSLWNR